ncbi:hypothetical protein JCM3765_002598 [Sporobolomyces pararoseus]
MSPPDSDTEIIAQWTEEQRRQSTIAIFNDESLPFQVLNPPSEILGPLQDKPITIYRQSVPSLCFPGLSRIAGFDVSFRDSCGEEGVAVLAVLSYPELKVIKSIVREISLKSTPYIHSFLSFRESDYFVSLLQELKEAGDDLPQILFVDGNGRWHSRQAGSAVAVGVKTGLPTIGVAKDYHPIHSFDPLAHFSSNDAPRPYPQDFMMSQKGMRKACQALLERQGDWMSLPGISTENDAESCAESWGAAVLASPARNASNPIFVSPGHRISLETSVKLSLTCCVNGKVPEPIRQADLIGRAEVKRIWG